MGWWGRRYHGSASQIPGLKSFVPYKPVFVIVAADLLAPSLSVAAVQFLPRSSDPVRLQVESLEAGRAPSRAPKSVRREAGRGHSVAS